MSKRFYELIEFDGLDEVDRSNWYLNIEIIRSACQFFKKYLLGNKFYNFNLLVSFDTRDCIMNDCNASLTKSIDTYIIKIDPNLDFKEFYTSLAHEFVHIVQDIKGSAHFDLYRGVVARSPDFDEMTDYEKEAYELEEHLFEGWLEEDTYRQFKDRIEDELL